MQRSVPSSLRQRAIAEGCWAAAERFWPVKAEEYAVRLLAFVLSEGGGLAGGNLRDPSYGVACVELASGRFACDYYGLSRPAHLCDRSFRDSLQDDARWCILVAAGELAFKEGACGGDWLRAVAMTKMGGRKFGAWVATRQEKGLPIVVTECGAIRNYVPILVHLRCLADRLSIGDLVTRCGCAP